MKTIKIAQILLIIASLLCFLGSHLLTILRHDIEVKLFFGTFVNIIIFVDTMLVFSFVGLFVVLILICVEGD